MTTNRNAIRDILLFLFIRIKKQQESKNVAYVKFKMYGYKSIYISLCSF